MPLPAGSCADDISTDVCCSTIFDIADRIRCVAYEAIACCIDESCADQAFRSYVSIGPSIPEPLGDALVVHMPDITPSSGSRSGNGNLLGIALHIVEMEIFLTENGWPMPEVNELGETISVPSGDYLNAIARHSYSHGEKMYRAIVDGVQKHTLFPLPANGHIGKVEIGGLRPVQPAAFTVGWKIPLRIQTVFQ